MLELAIQTLLLIPVLVFNSWFSVWMYKRRQKRNEIKFLKRVQVTYPDAVVSFMSLESSDKEAMTRIAEEFDARV